jgi:exodeoxyribonuclease-3
MLSKNKIKIATFNVNSIRARMPVVIDWIEKNSPDILCMQETKVPDDLFPHEEFKKIGYFVGFHGQKSYNGVAIASKIAPKSAGSGLGDIKEPGQTRLIWANIDGINVVNTYVPQGRDVDDPFYQYKFEWLRRFKKFLSTKFTPRQKVIWCGDLNVAPEDIDVHSPKTTRGHVCFNPDVTKALYETAQWGFTDLFRKYHPNEPGMYSWFDYRTRGSVERNIGWRVDHIFATNSLVKKSTACYIDMAPRKMEKPSDHTPVVAEFEI